MSSNSLAQNTLYLTLALVAKKVIAFVYFTAIANIMGVTATGTYFLALAFILIFTVIADWGLTPVLIREVAQKPSQAVRLTKNVLGLKIPFTILAGFGVVGLTMLLGYSEQIVQLVTIGVLVLAADTLGNTLFGVLRGLRNLKYEAVGMFIGQVIVAVLGAIILLVAPSLALLIAALFLGSLWNLLYAAYWVVKYLGKNTLVPTIQPKEARKLLAISFAFALGAIFSQFYSYFDSILLSKLIGEEGVGIYSIAYKITYAFQFLPMALVGALYPALSHLFKTDRKKLKETFDDSMWYVALLAVPIVFGIAAIADIIIPVLYPDYLASILPLQILIFVLLFIFLDFPAGSLLNAAHKQVAKTTVMGFTVVVNVVSNIILIPKFGVVGASIAALFSFTFMLAADMYFVKKALPQYKISALAKRITPIIFSGVVMLASVFLLKPFLHFVFIIAVAGVVYGTALFALGAVNVEHLKAIKNLTKGKNYETPPSPHN